MNMNSFVKKGDIVWVRIQSLHQWFPALVLHSNNLVVSVSFSSLKTTITPFRISSYFTHSDVLPFEQNFHTIINLQNNTDRNEICEKIFHLLLDSALRLLGQRVIWSLSCRCCRIGITREEFDYEFCDSGFNCFDPIGVLGFVSKGAVFPWVDVTDFAYAVRVVAQVHAFRSYSCLQQKKVYKKTTKRGDDVKLHPCLSLGQKMHSATQELTSESKDEYSIISKRGEENMEIGTARKRKRLDEPPLRDCSLTMPRILSFSSMNEVPSPLQITKSGEKDNSLVSIWSSALANCFSSCDGMEMDLYKAFLLQSPMKLKIQNPSSSLGFNVTLTCENISAACDIPLLEEQSCHISPQSGQVQEIEGNACKSTCTSPCISDFKMPEPEETSIQKDKRVGMCFSETTVNSTDEVQKVELRKCQNLTLQQSFACDSLSNSVPGIHSDNHEVDAKTNDTLGRNSSVDDATPIEPKKPARAELSKVGKQSKTHVPMCSTSLYMRFPKTFDLPSKEVLIKKFSKFGSINSSQTRLFTSSAQVTFFQEADAVAAHHYAKKKKVLFGEANVRFWLGPTVQKRKESKPLDIMSPSASKPIASALKSCLKKSNSLRPEDKKKRPRVRFTIET